ncbi:MAG: ABC transporter ATP-binding protein, partial [Candidatus Melainabacteria bacterium]|nr:ABC transporter ATP-binding protein [Candidatus Melainabacteria bacterium]
NGAGKTTTINMLTTLLSPTEGEFFIGGYHGSRQCEQAKACFGVVSQDVSIYQELTAYENLAFVADLYGIPRNVAKQRIGLLLGQAGLAERANDQAGEFSMGMQRKLSIATAILHEPKVLFMDEPTVGLDPQSRRQIWKALIDLRARGVTILLTTHYLEEAELLANRIGIIRQGKLVVEGTIEELREKIKGIRSIAIRLTRQFDADELKGKLDKLMARFRTQVHYDPLRNTISFAQPGDGQLLKHLGVVLEWLAQMDIPFSKFATSEPNLEEVFLSVAHGTVNFDPVGDGGIE